MMTCRRVALTHAFLYLVYSRTGRTYKAELELLSLFQHLVTHGGLEHGAVRS